MCLRVTGNIALAFVCKLYAYMHHTAQMAYLIFASLNPEIIKGMSGQLMAAGVASNINASGPASVI